jgi:membrane protease YdiL (CAAX protease family)
MGYYKVIIYIFSPVLLLIIFSLFKDKYEPEKEVLRTQKWSLKPAIILLSLSLGYVFLKYFWSVIPIIKVHRYSIITADILTFIWYSSILILAYLLLRYSYNVSLIDTFCLKFSYFPFIIKICIFLGLANCLSIYFLKFNLVLNPQKADIEVLKSIGIVHFIFYYVTLVIITPISEEILFRGLMYTPLYRKFGRHAAIVLTSLVFAHVHFYGLIPSVGVFIFGLVLVWLYDKTGSLVPPIILHMFRNSWLIIYYIK